MKHRPADHAQPNARLYTDEEAAWLKAVEEERRRLKRRFLDACDYLALAKRLGYERKGTEAP